MDNSSINVRLTQAQRQAIADSLPELADRLMLGQKNQRTIPFTKRELLRVHQKVQEELLHAENGTKRNSLRHIVDAVAKGIEDSERILAIPAALCLFQFKITLLGSKPPIWRRIQVADCTLDNLHEHIQTAMGWTNSHLHQFEIFEKRYGDPELLDDGFGNYQCIDSTKTKMSVITPNAGNRFSFTYEYDFGDSWEHEILFEGSPKKEPGKKYPICLEGDRACPPEDVGGIGGFYEFLEALADPKHEQHDDMKEWGGDFDPKNFDAKRATREMVKGLPEWRD